jgi:hypothetical protein
MPVKRFATNSDLPPDAIPLFENFGLVVYIAQIFERDLQVLITGLERLGYIDVPPDMPRSADGIVDACLGPMIRILNDRGLLDRDACKLLKKANFQRNLLAHRFMAESIADIFNEAGRESINVKLGNLHRNIARAQATVAKARDEIWGRLGLSREEIDRQIDEWRQLDDGEATDNFDT